ncbi:CBS domain-containing protein [Halomicrobium salinisoli]|uniref:CBS domain-containing protein n=1 Tax=Halomicrobium salinisoli TaxID=2878391 RepID=UPI001CF07EE1|nr:CBS domain-containing protein [Halomicrobium salinisoli]
MLVRELMATDVVTVDRDAALDAAVERMLAEDVGSVVVLADGTPAGIVTESDALRAALETGRPLAEIAVADLCHGAVVTTAPDSTVQRVARRMADRNVKKVPVLDGIDLVGIVTLTDVVHHLSDIRREASAVEAARDRWESDDA